MRVRKQAPTVNTMEREWYWRGGFIALITLGALYLLVPSYYYFDLPAETRNEKSALEAVLPSWAPSKKVNLGLDLQGGIHLVMEVDVDAAIAAKANNRALEMKDYLDKKDLKGAEARSIGRKDVEITLPEGKESAAREILKDFGDMELAGTDGNKLKYAFQAAMIRQLKDGAIDQSIKAVRNRVDKFGVTEPTIARRGANHILVQLPGFKDPAQAKELIGKTAQLEFRLVDDEDRTVQSLTGLPPGVTLENDSYQSHLKGKDQKALLAFVQDKAPKEREFVLQKIEERGEEPYFRTMLVHDRAALTGEYLTNAQVMLGDQGSMDHSPYVTLTFNKRGGDLFEKLTGENIQKRMAIVLDGIVDSAPVIQSRIAGGSARITLGGYKAMEEILEEARLLATVLKAGALPAPVTIAEQRTVGASLGPELIRRGSLALIVGTALVILFMLVYYKMSGLIADVALVLNGILIFSSLAVFGASLSMPGIAGIVLTLGMAVDANVIINERIREELRAGKSPRTAVATGYDRAFSAIFDSNLTTILAGIVLLQYGTGPIKGFAVTLIIGIIASMFTAIVVTRWLTDLLVARRPETLSI